MTDEATLPALDRIDRALARIAAAGARQAKANHSLAARHEALRTRIGEAIASLDTMIADSED